MAGSAPPLARRYAKLCDLDDFGDPGFRARAAELRPDIEVAKGAFDRKTWEFAMLTLFLEELALLDGRSEVLSVGAGREGVLFWLAPRVGRMLATDTYGRGEFAGSEAVADMLSDPARLSPFGLPVDRLETASMDARALELADASFDAVFSLSSIEHFGSPADIRRAAAEIGRVLRPGGVAYLATELQLAPAPAPTRALLAALRAVSGGRLGRREVFTSETLHRDVIAPSGLELIQPLDTSISARSLENVTTRRLRRLRPATGRYYPHIVLRVRGETFTSVGLPLRKRG